jgi:hypothetical protein
MALLDRRSLANGAVGYRYSAPAQSGRAEIKLPRIRSLWSCMRALPMHNLAFALNVRD